MSPLDRILRIVFAIGIVVLISLVRSIGPIIGVLLIVKAGTLVITSAFGFCPFYGLLDLKTSKR
jgi:hypothetical protein